MKSSITNQAERFLREHKNKRRYGALVLVLAAVVAVGTVAAVRHTGIAMTHTEQVLDCQLQVHQHTESCYATVDGERTLICGQADYVVHTHNNDCYDAEGNLVCPLPEIEKHEHTAACYTDRRVLVCTQAESQGHHHTDACYETRETLICDLPEDENHQHDESCYQQERVLVCTIPESDGHTHTDSCYETVHELTCGKLELHTHTDSCYDQDHNLICGKLELKEHVHGAGCFRTVEVADQTASTEEAPEAAAAPVQAAAPTEEAAPAAAPEEDSAQEDAAQEDSSQEDGVFYTDLDGENAPEVATQEEPSNGQAVAEGDFSKFVTNVTLSESKDGQWVQAGEGKTWREGEAVQVKLNFAFENLDQLKQYYDKNTGKCTFTYKIGDKLTFANGQTYDIMQGSQKMGSFTVNSNGTITVNLDYDKFASNEDTGKITGELTVSGAFTRTDSNNGYEYKFPCGNTDVTIKVQPEESESGLNVTKTGSKDKLEENKLSYKIEVKAPYGTKGDLVITDKISDGNDNVTGYDEKSFVVKDKNGNAVSSEKYKLEIDNNSKSYTLTILDSDGLDRDESYTVEYDVNVTPPTGRNEQVKIGNSVVATDKGNNNNKGEDKSEQTIESKYKTSKSGYFDWDTNTIVWTIKFSGAKDRNIKDILPEGVSASDITKFQVEPALENLTKKSLTSESGFKIPDDGSYTITYRTPGVTSDPGGKDVTVTNKVQYDDKDGDTGNVTIWTWQYNRGWNPWKQVANAPHNKDNAGVLAMRWNAGFSFPFQNWTTQSYTDTMTGGHYAKYGELKKAIESAMSAYQDKISYEVTFVDKDGNVLTDTPADDNTYVSSWTINLTNRDGTNGKFNGPYIGKSVNISYWTYVPDGLDEDYEGGTYKNTFGDKEASTSYNPSSPDPTPDPTPAPTPKDEKMVKANGSYTSDNVSINYDKNNAGNNVLNYQLLAAVTESRSNGFTITDVIPEGLELDLNSVKMYWYTNQYNVYDTPHNWGYGYQSLNNKKYVHVSYDKETRELKVIFDKDFNCKFSDGETTPFLTSSNDQTRIAVRYTAKMTSDAWKDPSVTQEVYTNSFSVDGTPAGSQTTTVNREQYQSRKTGQVVSNDNGKIRVRYAIEINPNGEDLAGGKDTIGVKDTLTIKNQSGETLNYETIPATLDLSSVKLYRYVVGENGTHYDPNYQMSDGMVTVKRIDEATRTVEFEVPNQVACVLVYEYVVDAGKYRELTISNEAMIGQKKVTNTQDGVEVNQGGGTVDYGRVTMTKVDSENYGKVLPGAQFQIQKWDAAKNAWDTVAENAVTDENGQIILEVNNTKGTTYQLERNTIYRFTETKAPDGYEISSQDTYLCVLSKPAEKDLNAVLSESGCNVSAEQIKAYTYNGGNLRITNKRVTLSVEKRWEDAYGKNIPAGAGSVDVVLEQGKLVPAPEHTVTATVKYNQEQATATAKVHEGKTVISWTTTWFKNTPTDVADKITVAGVSDGDYELIQNVQGSQYDRRVESYDLVLSNVSSDVNVTVTVGLDNYPQMQIQDNGATTVFEKITDVTTVNLSADNNWSYSWTVADNVDGALPETDGKGTNYVYRIREATSTPGYQVSYYNNSGVVHGTILVTNRQEENGFTKLEFPVTKKWLTADGTEDTANHSETVTFAVYQKTVEEQPGSIFADYSEDEDWAQVKTYSLTQENKWTTQVTDLPKSYTADGKTQYYVYCIREIKAEQTMADGTTVDQLQQYEVSVNTDENGQVTITNKAKQQGYELPETGGRGVLPWTLAGAAVLLAAGTYGIRTGRRRRRRQ